MSNLDTLPPGPEGERLRPLGAGDGGEDRRPLSPAWLACAALWLWLGPFIFERLRRALGPLLRL